LILFLFLDFNISFVKIKWLFCSFYFCHCQSFSFFSSLLHSYHNLLKLFLFHTRRHIFWLKFEIKFFLLYFSFFLHHLIEFHCSCRLNFFSLHRFKRLRNSDIKLSFSSFRNKIYFFINISLFISLKPK